MKNNINETDLRARLSPKEYPIRGEYYRDQTAIIHSMPFRRLKNKTQVFFAPKNDHVCTRIEHVMHVATIAATICKGLIKYDWILDPELAFAIGLGHDLGHAPFGHSGESVLSEKLNDIGGFYHEVNSLRVVDHLALDGKGLNLTYAVRDGIVCHNGENFEDKISPTHEIKDLESVKTRNYTPSTWEGCIVRFSDKIAYLGRDIEDAIVAGYISVDNIPDSVNNILGDNNSEIIDTLVNDIIESSKNEDVIQLSANAYKTIKDLADFNYEKIYKHKEILNYRKYGEQIISTLFDYLIQLYATNGLNYGKYESSLNKLDRAFGCYIKKMFPLYKTEGLVPKIMVCDYISGMTDLYALDCIKWITIPEPINFNKNI
jgi:dGTPase